MSQKTHSQDSNSEDIEWDIEELKKAFINAAENQYDPLMEKEDEINKKKTVLRRCLDLLELMLLI